MDIGVAERTTQQKTQTLIAWLGGWFAGPLPAFIILAIGRKERSTWYYRKSIHAAAFWTVLIGVWAGVIVVDIGFRSGPNSLFFVGWGLFVITSITATAMSAIQISRHASAS